jgi:hypothetical protein
MQSHSQLLTSCEQYNSLFAENELCLLQKAYTTPHFLILAVRFPGKTIVLYVGRGNQYQGIYLADKIPPSHLRVQDRLLDYIRKYLVGAKLSRINCESNKMLVNLIFKSEGIAQNFYFGWNDRQLHFGIGQADAQFNFLAPSEEREKKRVKSLEDYLKSKDLEGSKLIVAKKKEKFLDKKIINIKRDIEKNSKWKAIEQKLNAGEIDLTGNEAIVCDEKIKLKNCTNEWQKRDLVFQKIKKLKRGEEILKGRLSLCIKELEDAGLGKVEFTVTKEAVIQPFWPNQKKIKQQSEKNKKQNIRYIKLGRIDGVVGLDASANDEIRKNQKKEYFWFHLENYKGAHCILKTDEINQVSFEQLNAVASMLRDLSHLEILTIPVVYTQLKNVKGVKGNSGKVIVNKGKHLQLQYIEWKSIISEQGTSP